MHIFSRQLFTFTGVFGINSRLTVNFYPKKVHTMAKCSITGLKLQRGNHVSHANNKVKRTFKPNLQNKKYYSIAQGKFVKIKNISTRAMRIIDKHGIDEYLQLSKKEK